MMPAAFLLSDSPALTSFVSGAFPQLSASTHGSLHAIDGNRTARRGGQAGGSSISTRSWNNEFAAKLASVVDAISGGLAREVRFSQYSIMLKPAVARSMCTTSLVAFHQRQDSGCPRLDATFVRNLNTVLARPDWYRCMQQQLPSAHPCRWVSARECQTSFVRAMA